MKGETPQGLGTAVDHGDIGAHAERDRRRMAAHHSAAEDDHFGGRHARHAAEQNAAPARLALETMGTDLRREPAGDFRHRGQQRQAARGEVTVS